MSQDSQHSHLYVLSSGGTGGHLFPALALAEYMEQQQQKVFIVTDNRGALFFKGFERKPDLVCNIQRLHWLFGKLVYPFSLAFQVFKCLYALHQLKPKAVVGFGGYPSFPCVFAAGLLKIPTFLHEGNAFLGKANRHLFKKARRVGVSFPLTGDQKKNSKFENTGMPVRAEIRALFEENYSPSKNEEPFHLVIIGGSQGAKIFNALIPGAVSLLPFELQKRLVITQQCKEKTLAETRKLYSALPCKTELKTFLSPMDTYYKKAHLVIARAGASTIAELAIAGKPALLIPFAASVEGDQARNAQHLLQEEAVWVMKENSITPSKLAEFLTSVMTKPQELEKKALSIRAFARPDAVQNLWEMILRD